MDTSNKYINVSSKVVEVLAENKDKTTDKIRPYLSFTPIKDAHWDNNQKEFEAHVNYALKEAEDDLFNGASAALSNFEVLFKGKPLNDKVARELNIELVKTFRKFLGIK